MADLDFSGKAIDMLRLALFEMLSLGPIKRPLHPPRAEAHVIGSNFINKKKR